MSKPVTRESSIPVFDVDIDALVANENNVNEMTEAKLKRLVKEIVEFGFMVPLNVIPLHDSKYLILGGEHRWKAAKEAGMTYVPCCVHSDQRWTDIDQVDLQCFKLNAIKGEVNSEKFVKLYRRLCEKAGHEKLQDLLAVTDNSEWKKLTKNVEQGLRDSGAPQEVLDQVKDAERKARNPEELNRKLSKILRDYSEAMAATNVIMFQHGKGEHVVIRSSEELFLAMKKIVDYSNRTNQDVNAILSQTITDVANRLGAS